MQALLLAAGMGKRLGRNINKCMLVVHGCSLFEHTVEALKIAGITRIIVVTGYHAQELETFISNHALGMDVVFVRNTDYQTTNNIWSLYLAKDYFLQDDTLLLESDLIYDRTLLKKLVAQPEENVAVIAKWKDWMDGTTVTLKSESNRIDKFFSKAEFDNSLSEYLFKTVNIYKFSKDFIKNHYVPLLEKYILLHGKNDYYEIILGHLIAQGTALFGYLISNDWYEIDTELDLHNYLKENKYALSLFTS